MDQFEVPIGVRNDDLLMLETAELVHELLLYYSDVGWWVEPVEAGSTLHGRANLGLRKEFQYVLVQCAHWRTERVTAEIVEALIAATIEVRASGAILISSGEFLPEARAEARRGHVELIDYDHLYAMFGPLRGSPDERDPVDGAWMPAMRDEQAGIAPRLSHGGVSWRWLVAMACAIGLALTFYLLNGLTPDHPDADATEVVASPK